jgi:hypothetical protein
MLISGGSVSLLTLNIIGGLCHQTFIKARTDNTTFKVNITDDNSQRIRNYGIHKGELNDLEVYPLKDVNTINITNVSATDTFDIKLMVRE